MVLSAKTGWYRGLTFEPLLALAHQFIKSRIDYASIDFDSTTRRFDGHQTMDRPSIYVKTVKNYVANQLHNFVTLYRNAV